MRLCFVLCRIAVICIISFNCLLLHAVPQNGPGQLVDYTLVKRFPADELKAFFKKHQIPKVVLPVNDGINIYEVIYTSTYPDKSIVKASGLLYVPIATAKPAPLMIYNHGTEMCRDRSCDFTGEQTIGLAFATDGYIVLIPDYLGLGKGEKDQLYLNAGYEASASVDMLIAVEQVLPKLKVNIDTQLYVTGYSQGGHAAMATTRLLQQKYSDRFKVTASAPMSGPYNLEKTVYDGRNSKYEYPGFLFLLMQSYLASEGKKETLADLLVPPYNVTIPPLMDGGTPVEEIDKLLPDTVSKCIKPEFYNEFANNPESDFRKYLKRNNDFDWKPEVPLQLCYCDKDEEVNFQNSVTAYETMRKNGSTTVELLDAGKKFGHVNCALFAVIYTKMFFDEYRSGKPSRPGHHGPAFKRLLLNLGKLAVPSK